VGILEKEVCKGKKIKGRIHMREGYMERSEGKEKRGARGSKGE
jgi:hypothetical protein